MFKKIILGLFTLITLVVVAILAIAATRPNTYHVERGVSTGAAPQAVFDVLNDFHRFPEWSPWQKLDPAMKITYTGPASGVGASYAWVGNKEAGEGRMTITEASPPQSITEKLEFLKPYSSVATVAFHIAPEGSGSHVTWSMDGNHNLVSKVMCLFVSMDAMIGKDFEAGLGSLKHVAEASANEAPAAATGTTGASTSTKP